MADHLEPHYWAKAALGLSTYQWQKDALASVGAGFPTVVCAPNGSGKSSVTLTVAILWFLREHPKGRCVVTSGSWSQLKSQVFDSLKRFSDLDIFRGWEFLESSVKTPAGGYVLGLSVDDAFKMEGFHPRDNSPTLLCVDEAKAIQDSVFDSVDKCTWTYQVIVSSAGPASGRFYRFFTAESDYWVRRKVTYRDCPHLNDRQRLADIEIRGEGSTYYRNRWLSEFASDSGESIIGLDALRECVAHPPGWTHANQVSAGCDFAAGGGDFCCLSVARGNKIELDPKWYWRHANPKHSAGNFITLFRKLGLQSHQISGDADGLGVGFIYDLQESKFYIKQIHNGAASTLDDKQYGNIAAQWWDCFNILVTNRAVILPDNEALIQQLSNRRREYDSKARIVLESKADMKKRGVSSPDLADSVIMAAMTGYLGTPSSLNPAGTSLLHEELARCNEEMARRVERNGFSDGWIRF
jgi:phage terminase large subunit